MDTFWIYPINFIYKFGFKKIPKKKICGKNKIYHYFFVKFVLKYRMYNFRSYFII